MKSPRANLPSPSPSNDWEGQGSREQSLCWPGSRHGCLEQSLCQPSTDTNSTETFDVSGGWDCSLNLQPNLSYPF